jgi:hypothetical protein
MVGERAATPDLFVGVDAAINAHLGVTDYRTKTAARILNSCAPKDFVGENLVKAAFTVLRANWQRALPNAKASHQNFRWRYPQLVLARQNTSPEVTLERALMQACENSGRRDWCNQVPIISGVLGPHAYKRRAVDLVHRRADGTFEFVELKVASDTPLYATIEILLYGMLWLLSRESREQLGYPSNPILDTRTLQLSTLAPATFYAHLMPFGFADAINRGISTLGRQHGVGMGFRLTAFPCDFRWPYCDGHAELFHWFDDRVAVNQCV